MKLPDRQLIGKDVGEEIGKEGPRLLRVAGALQPPLRQSDLFGSRSVDVDARYQLIEKVGAGSFATVYRARDNELGREVAIKQIHDQFLDEPKQLERYWQEAQLLASLHHPNIVTIFDIHRDRGWLILELMQANLAERMEGRQMDLRALRTTVAHCLRALKYLHSRGIVHGDIKPSNMMIDARRRVKLGDFGLARRVSDADGSLLQGTTKYMAPETVSDEFGEIGPASDLYSLGFSAYELMCGPNFETLFPGMSALGRNKQAAWMMWQAAPDRRLPEVSRVLQGVPDDLATVIQKLCQKDQAKRYTSADDALSDLKVDLKVINKGGSDDDDAAPPSGTDPERKKRLLLAGSAFAASLIVCIILFLLPSGNQQLQGARLYVVKKVDEKQRTLRVEDLDNNHKAVKLRIPKDALITLEYFGAPENILLDELKPGDRLEIIDDESVMRIAAARPYRSTGRVVSVDVKGLKMTVALGGKFPENLTLRIPRDLPIVKNVNRTELEKIKDRGPRNRRINSRKIQLSNVLAEDRVEVDHLSEPGKKTGRVVSGVLFISRSRNGFGRITAVSNGAVTVDFGGKGRNGEPERVNLQVVGDCKISLQENGKTEKEVKTNRLRTGDYADVTYDTAFRKIHVIRGAKKVAGRIEAIRDQTEEIVIVPHQGSGGLQQSFRKENTTRIQIAGEPARFRDLRRGDPVEILFVQSASTKRRITAAISATRPVQRSRRAVLIGIGSFPNGLPKIVYSKNNLDLLAKTLSTRYGLTASGNDPRLQILHDPIRSGVRGMKARISQAFDASKPRSQILIYISTHAYVEKGEVYLAGRNIDPKRIAETGMRLEWLLMQMEKCKAKNKILLLDVCHEWRGETRQSQPSAADMMKLTKTPLKTSVVIAGCSHGQRGQVHNDDRHSAFAFAVHQAYSGDADVNRDLTITADELFTYLHSRMMVAEFGPGKKQLPQRFPAK